MGKGLMEFKENDSRFQSAFIYRFILASSLTGAWSIAAGKNRLISSPVLFKASLPLAFVVSFYYTKGIVYHLIGMNEANRIMRENRKENLLSYNAAVNSHKY